MSENVLHVRQKTNQPKKTKKPFREWLLNLCGYEIWPPTHNDPTIKGPQPRIISKRQREAMEKMRRENEQTGSVTANGESFRKEPLR